jgi:hypothetical protein
MTSKKKNRGIKMDMDINKIEIINVKNYKNNKSPCVIVGNNLEDCDLDFFHGIGEDIKDGIIQYTPCVSLEGVDLFCDSDEELGIDFYNAWVESSEYDSKIKFDVSFFTNLIKRIKIKMKKV